LPEEEFTMSLCAWLASIITATLAACTIVLALPNSAADELDRASAVGAMVVSVIPTGSLH
jgi:hypothetical protein